MILVQFFCLAWVHPSSLQCGLSSPFAQALTEMPPRFTGLLIDEKNGWVARARMSNANSALD